MIWPNPHDVRRALVRLVAPFALVFLAGCAVGAVATAAACCATGGCR